MRAVMYHYVRTHDPQLPFFRYLDVRDFERQLDHFGEEFGFVTRDEFEAFVRKGEMPREPGKVVLTFDDGVVDHHEHVLPALRDRGLFGFFYVSTAPLADGRMLDAHRIHLLCGRVPGRELLDATKRLVSERMLRGDRLEEFRGTTYTNQVDESEVLETKRILNYFIRNRYRSGVLDRLFDDFGLADDADRFYMSIAQLRAMERAGMIVGAHSVNHRVMSTLDRDRQRREIEESFEFLEAHLELPHRTYCHPYGGFHSFDEHTLALLEEADVEYAFNVESRRIEAGDRVGARHHLPRFDCNEFPHGAASPRPAEGRQAGARQAGARGT